MLNPRARTTRTSTSPTVVRPKRLIVLVVWVFSLFSFVAGAAEKVHDEPAMTPLMEAAYQGDLAAVKVLLQQGADVNEKNSHGSTALMMAAGGTPIITQVYRGSPEVVAYLI